jgi:hypothetical protein
MPAGGRRTLDGAREQPYAVRRLRGQVSLLNRDIEQS